MNQLELVVWGIIVTFSVSQPRNVICFLESPPSEHKLILFVHFQLTTIDPEETLKTLKLYPQETLMLEER